MATKISEAPASMSERVLAHAAATGLTVVGFDEIRRRFKEKRVDATDANRTQGHFDRWHRRRGLPVVDDEGLHKNASRQYFRMYQEDPEGEFSRPAYVNLWHYLIKAMEDEIPWIETPRGRWRAVPVIAGMVAIPDDPTPEELDGARRRLEAENGRIPDDAWKGLSDEACQRRPRALRIAEMVADMNGWFGETFVARLEV